MKNEKLIVSWGYWTDLNSNWHYHEMESSRAGLKGLIGALCLGKARVPKTTNICVFNENSRLLASYELAELYTKLALGERI